MREDINFKELQLKVQILLAGSNGVLESSQMEYIFRSIIKQLLEKLVSSIDDPEFIASVLYMFDMIADDYPELLRENQQEIFGTIKRLFRIRGNKSRSRTGTTTLQAMCRAGFDYEMLRRSEIIESLCYKIFDPKADPQDIIYCCISILCKSLEELGRNNWVVEKVKKIGGVKMWIHIIESSDEYDYHLLNNIEDIFPELGKERMNVVAYKRFSDLTIRYNE